MTLKSVQACQTSKKNLKQNYSIQENTMGIRIEDTSGISMVIVCLVFEWRPKCSNSGL